MYTKLFNRILDSSIWLETAETRIVWITLLAAMDQDGYAHFSAIENLASRARVTTEQAEAAVKVLCSPDPNSANPENEGRRLERVPGGFLVLNAKRHRETCSKAEQREATRLRVQRWRDRRNSQPAPSPAPPSDVTEKKKHIQIQRVTERNACVTLGVTDQRSKWQKRDAPTALVFPSGLDTSEFRIAWDKWVAFRKSMKRVKDWNTMFQGQLKWLSEYDVTQAVTVLETSIRNGWQGLFPPNGNGHHAAGTVSPAMRMREITSQATALKDRLDRELRAPGPERDAAIQKLSQLRAEASRLAGGTEGV